MTKRMICVILGVLLGLGTAAGAQAQLGGLIKKKVAEKVVGKTGNDTGTPARPQQGVQFNERVVELTEPVVKGLIKGLDVEVAGLQDFDKRLAAYKTVDEYDACKTQVATSPEGMQIAMQMQNLPENVTAEQMRRVVEKMGTAMNALIARKCGPSINDDWSDNKRREQVAQIESDGAAASVPVQSPGPQPSAHGPAAVDDTERERPDTVTAAALDAYRIKKERVAAWCAYRKLEGSEESKRLVDKGYSVGFPARKINPQAGGEFYFTAEEIKAIDPECTTIVLTVGKIELIMDEIYIRGRRR